MIIDRKLFKCENINYKFYSILINQIQITMKKIFIVLAIVFATGIFTGCSDEDVTPSRSEGESDLPVGGGI